MNKFNIKVGLLEVGCLERAWEGERNLPHLQNTVCTCSQASTRQRNDISTAEMLHPATR